MSVSEAIGYVTAIVDEFQLRPIIIAGFVLMLAPAVLRRFFDR